MPDTHAGAGRLMSRTQARRELSLMDFRQSIAGIYSTTVTGDTLDESPSAYKPMDEIIANMEPTMEVRLIIRPLYNFKA